MFSEIESGFISFDFKKKKRKKERKNSIVSDLVDFRALPFCSDKLKKRCEDSTFYEAHHQF
jgi:hypothetical protein